jgi:hypothetical protein
MTGKIFPVYDSKITEVKDSLYKLFVENSNIKHLSLKLNINIDEIKRYIYIWPKTKTLDDQDFIDYDKVVVREWVNDEFIKYVNNQKSLITTYKPGKFPKLTLDSNSLIQDETTTHSLTGLDMDTSIVVFSGTTNRESKFNYHKFPVSQRSMHNRTWQYEPTEEGLRVHRQIENISTYGYNMDDIGSK